MEELKRCPFCGGKAEIVSEERNHIFFVRCKKRCCRTYFVDSITAVIRTWNRRVEDEYRNTF